MRPCSRDRAGVRARARTYYELDDLRERRHRWNIRVSLCLAERERPSSSTVFVASSNLRMHHDVTADSFGGDELTGTLLLRQELEHLRTPRPDW